MIAVVAAMSTHAFSMLLFMLDQILRIPAGNQILRIRVGDQALRLTVRTSWRRSLLHLSFSHPATANKLTDTERGSEIM